MKMKEFSLLLGTLAIWIVLNRWILPWFGIPTCMSGGCATDRAPCCGGRCSTPNDKDVVETRGNQE